MSDKELLELFKTEFTYIRSELKCVRDRQADTPTKEEVNYIKERSDSLASTISVMAAKMELRTEMEKQRTPKMANYISVIAVVISVVFGSITLKGCKKVEEKEPTRTKYTLPMIKSIKDLPGIADNYKNRH